MPVQAIAAFTEAAAKNDNRAVYRSRFLLDQDKAVINVNQAAVYSALGLDAWAFHRAMTSVKTDPANSAAHLFLAGSLESMAEFTLPFTSEYLLARLLMPASANSFNSFNDYTVFFDKPDLAATMALTAGSHDARHGEISVSGALPAADVAFGVIGSAADADGWQKKMHERSDGGAAIIKWEPLPTSSLLLAVGTSEIKQVDLLEDNFFHNRTADSKNWRNDRTSDFEIGLHQRLASDTDLLLFLAYKKNKTWYQEHKDYDPPAGWPISVISSFSYNEFADSFYQGQVQIQHRAANHYLIAGAVHLWDEGEYDVFAEDTVDYIFLDGSKWTFKFPYKFNMNKRFTSGYIQDRWRISSLVTTEAALYFDRMENYNEYYGTDWIIDKVNPRFGLILTPGPLDTIRLAWSRCLQPFSLWRIDQMDIAGISLYRTSPAGSLTSEYAAVWEHEWQQGFMALHLFNLKSDLDFMLPVRGMFVGETYRQTTRQKGGEIRLNFLLGPYTGLAATYMISDMTIEEMPVYLSVPLENTDHVFTTISTSLQFVHPNGFSARISQTYRDQNFKDNSRPDDSFWLTDIGLSYELPNKSGTIRLDALNIFNNKFNWFPERTPLIGRNPAQEFILSISFNF